jgi:hypothetical protein
MQLPAYTELSNFNTRGSGIKPDVDLTIILIIKNTSDPVDTINSVYQFISKSRHTIEMIFINLDKEGYKYDKLLKLFPMMRVLLPRDRIGLKDVIFLAVTEALSNNILFIDDNCRIKAMHLDVMEMYLSESNYGMLLPLLVDSKEEVIPNIIKGDIMNGFIDTISTDIVGTAVSSIYPKYYCFILNKNAFQSRNIELSDYDDPRYTLLEMGYRLWKEGFIITQVRIFKVLYHGAPLPDITRKSKDKDYLSFNFINLTGKHSARGRKFKIAIIILQSIFTLNFGNIKTLLKILRDSRRNRQNNSSKPVEDSAIFSIINRDIK